MLSSTSLPYSKDTMDDWKKEAGQVEPESTEIQYGTPQLLKHVLPRRLTRSLLAWCTRQRCVNITVCKLIKTYHMVDHLQMWKYETAALNAEWIRLYITHHY